MPQRRPAGSNTYGGGTTVEAGTLLVANGPPVYGSATGTGSVTVTSGAALAVTVAGGSGTISPTGNNTVTIAGGAMVDLANSVTLTLAHGLTLQSGALVTADLTGTPNGTSGSNPLLAVSGGDFVVTGGPYTINLAGTPSAGSYDLINYSGATLSGTGPFALGAEPIGFSYQLNLNTSTDQLDLIVSGPLIWTGVNADGMTVNSSWDTTSGSTNWSDGGTANNYTTGRAVVFADTNPLTNSKVANPSVVVQTSGVSPSSIIFTNSGAANGGVDYSISNAMGGTVGIAGGTSITLQGTGNVTFTGINTFTGPVAVDAGQLILQNRMRSVLRPASPWNLAGAHAQWRHRHGQVNPIEHCRHGTIENPTGALNSIGGNNTYRGNITLPPMPRSIPPEPETRSPWWPPAAAGVDVAGNTLTITGMGNTNVNGQLALGNGGGLVVGGTGSTVTLASTVSLGSGSSVAVNSGTLAFDVTSGSSISSNFAGVSVSPGATLQLAGAISDLSDSTTPSIAANIANNGTVSVAGINQSVGVISGNASVVGVRTTYSGATIVGTGSTAIATQILQSTLSIGAGATVTIAPSSTGSSNIVQSQPGSASNSQSNSYPTSNIFASAGDDSATTDPSAIIEAAIASGEISGATGQFMEDDLTRIADLAAMNPRLDVSEMDSRLLELIPAASDFTSQATDASDSASAGNSESGGAAQSLALGVTSGGGATSRGSRALIVAYSPIDHRIHRAASQTVADKAALLTSAKHHSRPERFFFVNVPHVETPEIIGSSESRSLPELSIASASRNFLTICSGECRFLRLVIIRSPCPEGLETFIIDGSDFQQRVTSAPAPCIARPSSDHYIQGCPRPYNSRTLLGDLWACLKHLILITRGLGSRQQTGHSTITASWGCNDSSRIWS